MSTLPAETKATRLVSFLGTGAYLPTRHRFPDDSLGGETKYVCRALAEFLRADEIAVIATAEAEAAHGSRLADELRGANLPAPAFHRIPLGENTAELWRQFEVAKALIRVPAGNEVALDITHAFRSQPFFAAAVTSFVRAVDREGSPVRIFYAAFEARDQKENTTPVWDLTPFVDLLDWATALTMFLRTGRAERAADETERIGRDIRKTWFHGDRSIPEPRLAELGRGLRQFGRDLETLRTGDLLIGRGRNPSSAARLFAAVDAAREDVARHMPALADVLDRVAEMVRPLAGAHADLSGGDGHAALAALARMYLRFGRYLEATATVREGWVNGYAGKAAVAPGADLFDSREGERAEERAGRFDLIFRQVQDRRNDLLHGQYRPRNATQDAGGMIGAVNDLVDKFLGVPTTCLVNLTNHPSRDWAPEQTEAALALAERIEDLPFPNVRPEASGDDLPSLANSCLALVPKSATHALVQGEFTLAFEIVRRLQQRGLTCLAATTERVAEDSGDGRKTSTFRFVRFRPYPPLTCDAGDRSDIAAGDGQARLP